MLVENANVETANFALLFEFDGDKKKIRHVLYNCSASRPSIESATNEDEIEGQTETLALTATPLANGYVKAKTAMIPQLQFIRTGTRQSISQQRKKNHLLNLRCSLYQLQNLLQLCPFVTSIYSRLAWSMICSQRTGMTIKSTVRLRLKKISMISDKKGLNLPQGLFTFM